jgi:3-oxoacyl-[acyl-carrier protein] reductase
MTDVSNKLALVTGASRGIGRASVLALAEANARVIVHYGRSMTEANAVVEEIRSAGGQADAVQADLGTPDGATTLARRVRKLAGKKLDILVSNAGVSKAVPLRQFVFPTQFKHQARTTTNKSK